MHQILHNKFLRIIYCSLVSGNYALHYWFAESTHFFLTSYYISLKFELFGEDKSRNTNFVHLMS